MIPYTKYELLDKWPGPDLPDLERIADICEQCKKARRETREKKIVIDTILQPEAEKGN